MTVRSALAAAALITGLPGAANAQRIGDSISVRVEAYFAGINSTAQVGNSAGAAGTDIDFEDDLDLANFRVLPALEVGWRVNDDWLLQGQFYELGRRTEAILDRELEVGDTIYPVNANVTAGFSSDIYRFTISNLLFQRDGIEIGAALGLHATDFAVFLEGEGRVGGSGAQVRREGRSILAPLPTLGVFGQWEPTDRFTLSGRVDWLSLTVDSYSGRLLNAEAAVTYRLFRHVDAGAAYRIVDYRLRVTEPDWNGRVRYQFSGPSVFLRLGF